MSAVASSEPVDPRRLRLGPATRLLWRSPDSVHFELGSRGVVVEGLPPELVSLLAARSVPAHLGELRLHAEESEALAELARAGFLWARAPDGAEGDFRLAAPAPRLARELTATATRYGEGAGDVLRARRVATVVVSGSTAVAVHLAALLAAAGVGRVSCSAAGSARLLHALPGGVEPEDEGSDLASAAAAAISRAAPEANSLPLPPDERADLTVLAADAPIDEDRRAALHAARAAHLLVTSAVDHGVVGPLVVPGLTSCLRCADLHRRDRDPAWPALAAQLALVPARGTATDAALATVVVGTAALQALTFLDGGEPDCVEASLELHRPDWRLRRRSRPVHPDCDCADRFTGVTD